MQLQNVRDAKVEARKRLQSIEDIANLPEGSIGLAVGFSDRPDNYVLAVRIREKRGIVHLDSLLRENLRPIVGEDLDIRYTGPAFALQPTRASISQAVGSRVSIGDSISHEQSAGGTLGFFATDRGNGDKGIVSANHVIAEVDLAKADESIVRPATGSGGSKEIAKFVRYVPLGGGGPKLVDAAFARLTTNKYDINALPNGQTLLPVVASVRESTAVRKVGASTGLRFGKITSFDHDPLKVVGYSANLLVVTFEHQIEVESTDANLEFAEDGDSGALAYNDQLHAVGLLFTRCVAGGSLNNGLAYVSPMATVLKLLNVDFLA